jgi:endo-1,4-beta-xylanase
MITPENDMKFQFIHPLPNVYTFNEADDIVNFALENHMKVHGHALVWHEALPRWVTDTSRSSAETKQLLSDHIRTIVGHYQGKVAEWDVVNEPLKDINLSTTYGLRSENPWYQAMGEFYIDFAFREAHAADPNAQLYLNEYGIEEPGEKFDILYALLKRLLARGVPINGIGFQMHEDMQNGQYVGSEPKLVESNMQRIAALGLKVRISEMDINLNADHVSKHLLYVQACGFSDMLKMALRQPNLASFAVWGVTDRYCSLTFDYSTFGNGLLFDVNYHPKTAYTQVQQVLSQNSRLSCKDQDGTIILP